MFEKIIKKYGLLIFLLGVGQLSAMEIALEKKSDEVVAGIDKIAILRESTTLPLYQITSKEQQGSDCGLFALANAARIMTYLNACRFIPNTSLLHDSSVPIEYSSKPGFDGDKDFTDLTARARMFIIKRRCIASIDDKNPASVRDIIQSYMKERLAKNLLSDKEKDQERDCGIMMNILNSALLSLDPKVTINFDAESKHYNLTWAVDKDEFIEKFSKKSCRADESSDRK